MVHSTHEKFLNRVTNNPAAAAHLSDSRLSQKDWAAEFSEFIRYVRELRKGLGGEAPSSQDYEALYEKRSLLCRISAARANLTSPPLPEKFAALARSRNLDSLIDFHCDVPLDLEKANRELGSEFPNETELFRRLQLLAGNDQTFEQGFRAFKAAFSGHLETYLKEHSRLASFDPEEIDSLYRGIFFRKFSRTQLFVSKPAVMEAFVKELSSPETAFFGAFDAPADQAVLDREELRALIRWASQYLSGAEDEDIDLVSKIVKAREEGVFLHEIGEREGKTKRNIFDELELLRDAIDWNKHHDWKELPSPKDVYSLLKKRPENESCVDSTAAIAEETGISPAFVRMAILKETGLPPRKYPIARFKALFGESWEWASDTLKTNLTAAAWKRVLAIGNKLIKGGNVDDASFVELIEDLKSVSQRHKNFINMICRKGDFWYPLPWRWLKPEVGTQYFDVAGLSRNAYPTPLADAIGKKAKPAK